MYCGVFCLLAIRGARDWRRAENIQLQQLQDHHVFPKAYLKRHDIRGRVEVNSIVNRTLISDETNGKIRDKAPADYMSNTAILPRGPSLDLLTPHFIDASALDAMLGAKEGANEAVIQAYSTFRKAREALILEEIRTACGVPAPANAAPIADEVLDDELAHIAG